MVPDVQMFVSFFQDCVISDCGELAPGEDWCTGDINCPLDTLPPFPDDWDYEPNITVINFIYLLVHMKKVHIILK